MKKYILHCILFLGSCMYLLHTVYGQETLIQNAHNYLYPASNITCDDTIKYPKTTINDYLIKERFNGIILLNGNVINRDDSILFKPNIDGFLLEVTILRKVSKDLIKKYGSRAEYGILSLKTK